MSFSVGDTIQITERCNDDWFQGIAHGKIGLFPANRVGDQVVHEHAVIDEMLSRGVASESNSLPIVAISLPLEKLNSPSQLSLDFSKARILTEPLDVDSIEDSSLNESHATSLLISNTRKENKNLQDTSQPIQIAQQTSEAVK